MFKFLKKKKYKTLNYRKFNEIVWINNLTPKKIILKLKQSKLDFCKVKVVIQENVYEGQILATNTDNSYYLLAPFSGKVIEIDEEKIIIQNINYSSITHFNESQKYTITSKNNWQEVVNQLKNKGVYGLGGGCFPTHKKFKFKPEFLIINIMQSEINNYADFAAIIANINILKVVILFLKKIINPKNLKIALNKELYQYPILKNLFKEFSNEFEINIIENNIIYGSEKVLIKYYKDLYSNTKKISINNTLCFNISTCIAIYDALKNNKILNKRWISIYDERIDKLYLTNIYYGSLIEEILQIANIHKDNIQLISGGDMMGSEMNISNSTIQFNNYSFIIKNKQQESSKKNQCINCLKCNDICPVKLEPSVLYKNININLNFEININECIECGMCSYVCPSKIELSRLFAEKKNELYINKKLLNEKKNYELKFELKSKRINLKNKVLGRKKFTKRIKSNLIEIDNISKEISLIKLQIKTIESNINLAKNELIKGNLKQSKQKLLTRLNELEKQGLVD